jgi:hypothetical protein
LTTSYLSQTDRNWAALDESQKDYFRHLSAGDPTRSAVEFFEQTVPENLQDNPELLEVWLDGGTVTKEVWVPAQGAANGQYEQVEYTVEDRDWSHDVSRANGGSDSADNGRFEDASTNRARGSRNSTEAEQQAADEAGARDAEFLEDSTVLEDLADVADASAWGVAADVAGGLLEASLDFALPVAGGAVAAKKVYDHFDTPADKVGWSALAGGGTVAFLASPAGAPVVGAWVLWNVGSRGVKLWKKHVG